MAHQHAAHDHDAMAPILDRAFWEERYASAEALWSGNPNPQLVAEASGLAPGRALDVACGEGADALWLAGRGWRVTGLDLSQVALTRAAAHATEAGLAERVTWLQGDLLEWAPEAGAFDLVSAQFFHLPSAERLVVHARLAAAVAPGGTLLIVTHDPSGMHDTGEIGSDYFATAEQVAQTLDPAAWSVVAAEARSRPGVDPDGQPMTFVDAVLVARRVAAGEGR